ncbi:MAG: response regulator, partial [Candidatus Eisenbacteria bacterium]|nr:response regulator [Candidatus Eisenbacteria bacterium]
MTEEFSASENTARETTHRETLLVVDDDVRVVELLQITLGGRGYDVQTAYDGETALKLLKAQTPDLVVLDVRLPKKGGLDVLQALRKDATLADVPVILISANAATEARLQGLRLGADDYVTKPFSPRALILR